MKITLNANIFVTLYVLVLPERIYYLGEANLRMISQSGCCKIFKADVVKYSIHFRARVKDDINELQYHQLEAMWMIVKQKKGGIY